VVRRRLTDPTLRRLLDSMDICQSVLASFFIRAAAGAYDLEQPEQLLKLLAVMARNKLVNQVQKHRAARRRPPPPCPETPDPNAIVDPGASPSQVVSQGELLEEFRRRLSSAERQLADQRAQGRAWTEIAAELGGSPDGLRMQLQRAIERVTQELGLDA
jgi:DNA-directed RNA polymerase specialized sigma24 family protein